MRYHTYYLRNVTKISLSQKKCNLAGEFAAKEIASECY